MEIPWLTAADKLPLSVQEVQIWQSSLNVSPIYYNKFWEILNSAEQARAKRFHFNKDQVHFTTGRALLRILLSKYLDVSPSSIDFQYGDKGKPELVKTYKPQQLYFNISHSNNLVVFAFTRAAELGVDVEFHKDNRELMRIAKRFFSKHEFTVLQSLPAEDQNEGFYNCWTRKEAFIKAVGSGLYMPLNSFAVTLKPKVESRLLWMRGETDTANSWQLFDWKPLDNYGAALAIRNSAVNIRIMNHLQNENTVF